MCNTAREQYPQYMKHNNALIEDLRRLLITGIITILALTILLRFETSYSFLSQLLSVSDDEPVDPVTESIEQTQLEEPADHIELQDNDQIVTEEIVE